MSQLIHIYLSGSVKKGATDSRESFWSDADIAIIEKTLDPIRVIFLNPSVRSDDLSDSLSTFGRDLFQVYCSDLILVDARDKRGIGVGAEMIFAKLHQIPVVSILPSQSHYSRQDFEYLGQHLDKWIHPFVYGPSDKIVPTVQDAANWIRDELQSLLSTVKGQESLEMSMAYYITNQLQVDLEMKSIVLSDESLRMKVAALLNRSITPDFLEDEHLK